MDNSGRRAGLAEVATVFGARLRATGLPVGPDRRARFARAVTVLNPLRLNELYWCAAATLIADPAHLPILDAVFAEVFGGAEDPAAWRGQTGDEPVVAPRKPGPGTPTADGPRRNGHESPREVRIPGLASAAERLSGRDFAELSPADLALLAATMRRLRLHTPLRRSRRRTTAPRGRRVDLRRTLAQARRTGGIPVRLARFVPREKPRRLVVLLDISGSMEPYARALLQLLYCAAGGQRAEVFTFATRLTRLTAVLARARPQRALDHAGRKAPDWSGGTRIADSLAEFNRRHGRRGLARGAVVLIVSDGWETGDATDLGREMARLSRVAHRIVWANPRTASPRFRPLTGGMAAAWPYCDAVVSAHRLDALDELLAALAQRY
ncbi:MAG TPA: VWA domain-containing protein [Pseudonocardiaceae bacterium]|nr:VWA domain-containing protein [Pseudonocardiaceae bacterium]